MSNMNNLYNNKKNEEITNDNSEINFIKRTIDNYTHEDISDKKIKKITTWRKSKKKFLSVLILNLLTLGILHLVSKCYPKLYLKLYCNICSPQNSDFFLVEDIYGQYKLCQTKKQKKNLSIKDFQNKGIDESSKAYMCLFPSWNKNLNLTNDNPHGHSEQNIYIHNNPIVSFTYNSKVYEYNEDKHSVIPVYLNLAGKTNKYIMDVFNEGLSSKYLAKKMEEKFGKNELKLNIDLINIYYNKVEKKLLIYSIICGSLEFFARDGVSFFILFFIILFYFIFKRIFMHFLLKSYDTDDMTIDGEKSNRPKVRRKYLFKNNDNKAKEKKIDKQQDLNDNKDESNQDIKSKNKSSKINNYKISINNTNINKMINGEENEIYKSYNYAEINNNELLPGDIIYLKEGDYVPCDGILLEKDCIVNEIEVNETMEHYNKTFLRYTNDIFDYKKNQKNILLHGMKVVKIFQRNINDRNKLITMLCINTGSNTYKANQITNVVNLLERKPAYKKMYALWSGQRLLFFICISAIFFFSVLIPSIMIIVKIKKKGLASLLVEGFARNTMNNYFSNQKQSKPDGNNNIHDETMKKIEEMKSQIDKKEVKDEIIRMLLINYFTNFFFRIVIKSYMPVYFVISSIIILIGVFRLYKLKIICYEKMRLIFAADINTVFMSKINILSDDKYEIEGYHPVCQSSKVSNLFIQTFYEEQIKDFGSIIFSYYNNIKSNMPESSVGTANLSLLNKTSGKFSVWFLECLLCCNSLIKVGQSFQGNMLEKKFFDKMKWEFKVVNDDNISKIDENYLIETSDSNTNSSKDLFSNQSDEDNFNEKLFYYGFDKEVKYTYNRITDLFPQNYYRMTDTRNYGYQKLISRFKYFLSKSILAKRDKKKNINLIDNNKSDSINNIIMKDISNTKCASYKLRIYKKFITKNSLFSSAIVYNFFLKTLRFMTKGSPEKILPHCITSSLPGDIYKTISNFRKDGYIIIICASKKIDLYSYKESRDESYYLRDLIFCGLITLKNKIKKESKKFIYELEKLNCQLIMNTGDNVYNSIGTGFEIGLLDNTKKLFVLDLDENKKQIYIANIYRPPEFDNEILDKIEEKRKKMKRTKIMKKIRKADLSMVKKIREDNTTSNTNIQTQTPSSLDKNDSPDSNIKSINKGSVMSKPTFNQNKYFKHTKNMISKKFLSSSRNEDSELISERSPALRKVPTINNNENESKNNISNKKIPLFKKYDSSVIGSSSRNNKSNVLLSPSSNKKSNYELNSNITLNKTNKIKNTSSNQVTIEKTYSFENSKKNLYYNATFIEFESEDFEKEEFMKEYFSNICYYSKSLLKYIENNSILCVSGKALKFIYENKNDNNYSLLLKFVSENTKIFFLMTSEDKSFLIDYYRELPDKKTCMIGYSTSDIDSMMTAHVGVTIKKPTNINMILSHFYLSSKNLINIKTIIEHGRVILENFMLLFFSCLFCTTIINIYMSLSFYTLMEIKPQILRTLDLIFYILCLFGFTSSVDKNATNSLMRNSQFFWKYIIVHIIGNIVIKTYDVIIFCYIYRQNSDVEENRRNSIYISYFSILSFNQIFTTLFGFNFIRFYRRSIIDNFLFTSALIIFFFLILIISCLSRIGLFEVISRYYSFEKMKMKSDTFDDRNKLMMFIIIVIDLISTILFIISTQYFFNKKADNLLQKVKKK